MSARVSMEQNCDHTCKQEMIVTGLNFCLSLPKLEKPTGTKNYQPCKVMYELVL